MRTLASTVAATLLLACGCQLPPPQAPPNTLLPLHAVRFYDSGVAYFERSGTLSGTSGATLPVPPSHLDDALKSVVVLGTGGAATVDGLEFASSVTPGMARALAGLPTSADEPLTWLSVLQSARGGQVEIRTRHRLVTGRLIEVQELQEPAPEKAADSPGAKPASAPPSATPSPAPDRLQLLLLTEQGAIERIPATQLLSVRPLDPAYAARLRAALDAASSQGARRQRQMRVLAHASGPVTIGYVAEAPVWRTTYRLVLTERDEQARLQGWALLHNDTEEDWRGVRVHLVNGQPDSFLVPLAAPRYLRRELLTPPRELSTVPQLLNTTPDALYGDEAHGTLWGESIGESYGAAGMGLSGTGMGGGGSGEGSIRSATTASTLLDVGNLARTAEATATVSGALFDYEIAKSIDLRSRGSALVPFLSQPVTARRIAWLQDVGAPARAGVRFINTTNRVLPAGPISVFASGGFAGETVLDRVMPGETRFARFGADLDVDISFVSSAAREEVKRLAFDHDVLTEHYLRRRDITYAIENRGAESKQVCLVLDVVVNATVEGPDEVTFDAESSRPIAIYKVAPRAKAEREMHSQEGLSRQTRLEQLRADRLAELAASTVWQDADRDAITQAAARQKEAEETGKKLATARDALAEVDTDLERLRKDLQAAGGDKGAAGATHPFVRRILDAEDRRTKATQRIEVLTAEQRTRTAAVRGALEKLAPPRRAGN